MFFSLHLNLIVYNTIYIVMQTVASSHAEDYLLKIYIPFVSKATEEKLKISICTHD